MPSGLGCDEVDFWDGAEGEHFCCWDRDAQILLLGAIRIFSPFACQGALIGNKWNCELRCGGVKIQQWLTGTGPSPSRSFPWWRLCCLLGKCKANVTIADVCRCLQMCCWPQQQDGSPASPGHSVSLGSTRKQNWSAASCWIHLQPSSSLVAKAGWVSPWGTAGLQ